MRKQGVYKLILGITGGYGTGKTTVAGFFRDAGARVIDADKIAHDLIAPDICRGHPEEPRHFGRGDEGPRLRVYKEIIKYFGKGIVKRNRCIDRNKLAKIAFAGAQDIKRLNRIMHPEIKKIIKRELKQACNEILRPACGGAQNDKWEGGGAQNDKWEGGGAQNDKWEGGGAQNDRVAVRHSDPDVFYRGKNLVVILDAPLLFETGLDKLVDKVVVVKTTREKQFKRLLKHRPRLSKQQILSRINAQMPLSEKVRQADFIIDNNGTVEQTRKQVEKIIRRIAARKKNLKIENRAIDRN